VRGFLQNDMAKGWELREGVLEKLPRDVGCHIEGGLYMCTCAPNLHMHRICFPLPVRGRDK
jgi:hypothetical protein